MRVPHTIWRYLSLDLWRLAALTTAVILCVACFAVAIKPLADGRLGPLQTLYFMLLAAIPMLQYALPFAGGFAATLVYHRFAADNEAVASAAGGVSHRSILAPALLCAVLMAGALGVLIDQAMPRLLRHMERLVTGDLTRLLESAVGRGESIRMSDSDRYIFADGFVALDPGTSGADQHFALTGLLATELDEKGAVKWEASARVGYVWLFQESASRDADTGDFTPGTTTVVMQLVDSVGGQASRAQAGQSTLVYKIPNQFTEDPKYLTWTEMNEAARRPELLTDIDRRRRALAARVSERLVTDVLRRDLAARGELQLVDAASNTVVVRAGGISQRPDDAGFSLAPLASAGDTVEVTTVLEDGRTRLHRARRASISQPASPDAASTLMTIRLEEVSISGPGAREMDPEAPPGPGGPAPGDAPQAGVRASYTLSNLAPSVDPLRELLALPLPDLQARAAQRLQEQAAAGTPDEPLRKEAQRLTRDVRDARREIVSKQHERVASVLACVVTVLIGAIMALRLRESLPLPVYLWSFLPAVAAVLTINGGQKVAADSGWPGLILLYGGVLALIALTWWEYRALARH